MHLFKKTILTSLCVMLLSVTSFAQTTDRQSTGSPKVDIMSSWMNHDTEALSTAFNGYSPTWGSYLIGLEKGAYPYAELFNAFKADFISQYRTTPNRDAIGYLQQYYEQRKNDPAGHLLLPTIAIWCNYPLTSIIPLENHLNAYWKNPDLAGDVYDFMSQIDSEETFYSVVAHMGALKGHPTNQSVLEFFWTNWASRAETSAARADVTYLKQSMLEEILKYADDYGAAYAVQELASSSSNLWPAIHVNPITPANQARVQYIISSYCIESNFPTSCKAFIDYAYSYGYITSMPQRINNYVMVSDPTLSIIVDPWYYIGYHRIIYTYPLWTYWHHRSHKIHPRHHPHPGHHPHVTPPAPGGHGGHRPGHSGGGHRPGGNPHPNGGHGGDGEHPGGHGGHGGHPGDRGGHSGNPGGHDGHGDNGSHGNGGHNPHPGGIVDRRHHPTDLKVSDKKIVREKTSTMTERKADIRPTSSFGNHESGDNGNVRTDDNHGTTVRPHSGPITNRTSGFNPGRVEQKPEVQTTSAPIGKRIAPTDRSFGGSNRPSGEINRPAQNSGQGFHRHTDRSSNSGFSRPSMPNHSNSNFGGTSRSTQSNSMPSRPSTAGSFGGRSSHSFGGSSSSHSHGGHGGFSSGGSHRGRH